MPESDWGSCLEAAGRQVEIAVYHRDCLARAQETARFVGDPLPPIPVQAHFEGVVIAICAAIDKVAEAANKAAGLELSIDTRRKKGTSWLAERLLTFRDLEAAPINRDLRKLRTEMIHYSYKKSPRDTQAGPQWDVQSVRCSTYDGSRELLAYAGAAVEYARRFEALLPEIKQILANRPDA